MAHNLIKIIITGVQVVGRAFSKAIQKEYAASQQAAQKAGGGKKGNEAAAQTTYLGMNIEEAKEILNISNLEDQEKIVKNYEHLMKVNDKKESGGSFYLQSKVYRAKERIDIELKNDQPEAPQKQAQT